VLRPLVSGGFALSPNAARLKLFKAALADLDCGSRVRLVKRTGWHGPLFVMPSCTIGHLTNERVVFDGRAEAARYEQSGTLQEWKDGVAAPAAGNSRLILAQSTALAGPLNDLLQGEGGGIHLVGGSSLGKTTALVAAGSVWGGGGRAGFTQTWRATGNGLESVARAHSGTLLALDELGELDAREAGATAYLLTNGLSKIRATRDADTRPRSEWRIMLLSAGEVGLADKIAEGGRKAKAGQLVRLVDVPADAGAGFGLYEDAKGQNPAAFSKAIKQAALQIYGTAGPAFVEALATNPEQMTQQARIMMGQVTARMLEGHRAVDGQLSRVAERFALVAVAGELARTALGLPWAEGEAKAAARTCFQAWQGTRGGDGPAELVGAVEAIRSAVERHGESRFRNLDQLTTTTPLVFNSGPIRDLLGYRFLHEGSLIWGFTATGWREVLSPVGRPSDITGMLAERGLLLMTLSDRACRFIRKVEGRPTALYAVKAAALEE
jgi:putative DNA primase/helicase